MKIRANINTIQNRAYRHFTFCSFTPSQAQSFAVKQGRPIDHQASTQKKLTPWAEAT